MTKKPASADPRRIAYLPLQDLKVDPRNPRTHNEEQIGASIGRFGVLDLITLDERTGYIVSGHGRHKTYARMEENGDSPPEGVKVAEDGTWLIPTVVGWASRSDYEARAALIALNRSTELGGWMDEPLMELLQELDAEEGGFEGVGFGTEDLDRLLTRLDSDDVPEGYETVDFSQNGQNSPGVASYTMVFDTADDLTEWQKFLRSLSKDDESGSTIASLVLQFVREHTDGVA